jgi:hypothetical protein
MVTDLANEILLCLEWDPHSLHSPAQEPTADPELLPVSIPFAPACSLAVNIPVTSTSGVDSFIKDLVLTFLDTLANCTCCPFAVPLAIHVTSGPHAGHAKPIQQHPLLSPEKLQAEGLPVEVQNVLGWTLDTRRLLILLPHDKYLAWSGELHLVLTSKTITHDSLESMIGHLNHISFLIPYPGTSCPTSACASMTADWANNISHCLESSWTIFSSGKIF